MRQELSQVKSQLQENTSLAQAVLESDRIISAEIEGLKLGTASRESVERIEGKLDDINKRLFDQAGDIRLLKTAK